MSRTGDDRVHYANCDVARKSDPDATCSCGMEERRRHQAALREIRAAAAEKIKEAGRHTTCPNCHTEVIVHSTRMQGGHIENLVDYTQYSLALA